MTVAHNGLASVRLLPYGAVGDAEYHNVWLTGLTTAAISRRAQILNLGFHIFTIDRAAVSYRKPQSVQGLLHTRTWRYWRRYQALSLQSPTWSNSRLDSGTHRDSQEKSGKLSHS